MNDERFKVGDRVWYEEFMLNDPLEGRVEYDGDPWLIVSDGIGLEHCINKNANVVARTQREFFAKCAARSLRDLDRIRTDLNRKNAQFELLKKLSEEA